MPPHAWSTLIGSDVGAFDQHIEDAMSIVDGLEYDTGP